MYVERHGYFFEKKKKTLDDEFNSENGVSNFAFDEGIKVKKKKKQKPTNQICNLHFRPSGLGPLSHTCDPRDKDDLLLQVTLRPSLLPAPFLSLLTFPSICR